MITSRITEEENRIF